MPDEVLNGFLDRSGPDEAEVTVAGLDRLLGVQPVESWPVDDQLPSAEPVVAEPFVLLVDLGTQDIAGETVRGLPIRHGDHAMVAHEARIHRRAVARMARPWRSRARARGSSTRGRTSASRG